MDLDPTNLKGFFVGSKSYGYVKARALGSWVLGCSLKFKYIMESPIATLTWPLHKYCDIPYVVVYCCSWEPYIGEHFGNPLES